MVLRLLYKAAEWHALAKLRMHTDSTLDVLEAVTREFGRLMRQFRDKTSDEFDTRATARNRFTERGNPLFQKEETQLEYLQVPCAWGLCCNYLSLWDDGFILNTSGQPHFLS